MKSYQALLIGLLIGLVLLTVLVFPTKGSALFTNTVTAPTATPTPKNGPLVLESGDTQGLMYGAGVILLIILGGVLIHLLFNRTRSKNQD